MDKDMINFVNSEGEKDPFQKAAEEFITDPESLDKVVDRNLLDEMKQYQDKYDNSTREISNQLRRELNQLKSASIPIDRYGSCPHCNTSWDGGDILEVLSNMDVFQYKSRAEMLKIAAEYGYDEDNKKRFSTIIGVEITPAITFHDISKRVPETYSYLQCPSCYHVFEAKTGKHFNSLNEARNSVYE